MHVSIFGRMPSPDPPVESATNAPPETAAQHVLRLPEMVEPIVDEFDCKELFLACRINRIFLDTINKLDRFADKMFLPTPGAQSTSTYDFPAHGRDRPSSPQLSPFYSTKVSDLRQEFVVLAGDLELKKAVTRFHLRKQRPTFGLDFWTMGTLSIGESYGLCSDARYSQEQALRVGLDLPGPILRTSVTQPVYATTITIAWTPKAKVSAGADDGDEDETISAARLKATVNVKPAVLGKWFEVARTMVAFAPSTESAKDWPREPGMNPKTIVNRCSLPAEVQVLLCTAPVYTYYQPKATRTQPRQRKMRRLR